jgi:ribonuclease P protein component
MVRRQPEGVAMGRLLDSSEFVRVLGSRSRASTPHFAVHHMPARPSSPLASASGPTRVELSTKLGTVGEGPVDDLPADAVRQIGAVVPKRHARRAVTRSLLKRQIYAASGRHAGALPHGLWIVRLRAPFDRKQFPSAASEALRLLARDELETLFRAAAGAA